VAGVYSGVGQGVLRVSATAPDADKRKSLRKVYDYLRTIYSTKPLYVTLTANVILRSTTSTEFSIFFGQSFGGARAVYFGQEHDGDSGELTRLYTEFKVEEPGDLQALPLRFTTEDFAAIYKRNFAKSNVAVHRLVSLVYFFSVGLDNYDKEHRLPRNPILLF
jgi:hypothetical protein